MGGMSLGKKPVRRQTKTKTTGVWNQATSLQGLSATDGQSEGVGTRLVGGMFKAWRCSVHRQNGGGKVFCRRCWEEKGNLKRHRQAVFQEVVQEC